MQKQTPVLAGDLNLNRPDTNKREGKILKDLEDGFGLECLITSPTRISNLSSTVIAVILMNRPDIFTKGGTYNPYISDHCLIYGLINEKITHYKPKTILCWNLKTTDCEQLTDDLSNALWHVDEIFTEIDDRIDYWNGLMNYMINYHAPTRRKRVRENDVPYMIVDWKKAIRKKRLFAKTKLMKTSNWRRST